MFTDVPMFQSKLAKAYVCASVCVSVYTYIYIYIYIHTYIHAASCSKLSKVSTSRKPHRDTTRVGVTYMPVCLVCLSGLSV